MRILPFTIAVLATSALAADWERSGPKWEANSASFKEKDLWTQISSNAQSNRWFTSIEAAGIFIESMDPTLHWIGDTFQNGWTGPRNKYAHTVGSAATFKFVPKGENGYTGVFKGSDNGIIRFSAATEPDYTKTTEAGADGNFAPGIALKFLRDGVLSGNMVALYGPDGQPSWNFFEYDFTNHLTFPKSSGGAAIFKRFSSATPFVQYVGLSDMATFDQTGHKEAQPKFPFELVFRPDSEVKAKFPKTFEKKYTEQVDTIEAGTRVYSVLARAEPDAELVEIGDIVLTSKPTTSYFGDKYLFFRHQDMQEDVALRPEWKSHLNAVSSSLIVG